VLLAAKQATSTIPIGERKHEASRVGVAGRRATITVQLPGIHWQFKDVRSYVGSSGPSGNVANGTTSTLLTICDIQRAILL